MSAETKQVLEMLKDGKITTEDAEKLLDKLSGALPNASSEPSSAAAAGGQSGVNATRTSAKPRYLRVMVQRPGRENVNMRIPLALAKAGTWLALIPPGVRARLADHEFDLSSLRDLNPEQLSEVIENTNIDIDREDGRKVRIYCE